MIFVDSSVWIDYFNGAVTLQTEKLHSLLELEPLVISDLVLTEVLQSFTRNRDFEKAVKLLTSLEIVSFGGETAAIQAARNFRSLQRYGVTIRKTIDSIIATGCIEHGFALLHNDKDFEPFVKHFGLRSVC